MNEEIRERIYKIATSIKDSILDLTYDITELDTYQNTLKCFDEILESIQEFKKLELTEKDFENESN